MVIGWTDKSQVNPKVTAASFGDVILIAHVAMTNRAMIDEVVQLTPSDMTEKVIYHNTRNNDDGNDDMFFVYEDFYERGISSKERAKRRCVRKKVIFFSTLAGMIVWVGTGAWLVLREGIPSGSAPIVYAVVGMISALTHHVPAIAVIVTIVGTILFHILLCCGGGGMCGLPKWIGREIYVSSLYAWITAFAVWDLILIHEDLFIACLVYLAISGLVLDHPVVQVMGMVSVGIGVVVMCLAPFSGWFLESLFEGLVPILIGFGMIAVGNCFSSSRLCLAAICRPFGQAFGSIYHGQPSSPPVATTVPAQGLPTTIS